MQMLERVFPHHIIIYHELMKLMTVKVSTLSVSRENFRYIYIIEMRERENKNFLITSNLCDFEKILLNECLFCRIFSGCIREFPARFLLLLFG